LEDMRDNPNIKVGSYVQICNEMDEPEWWIITHLDDRTQFRQFSILKCLYVYRWVSRVDGKRRIYECLGAPRNQSSYNSGVWLDYTFQVPENQHIAVLPTNDDSRTLMYDNKLLVGDPLRYPPIAMKVSKIQSSLNGEITHFTMTQEQFNPSTDNAEKMLADYWQSAVEPELPELEEVQTISDLEITYSGLPSVKAGGGYKKFVLQSRIDDKLVDVSDNVEWSIDFGGNEDKLSCPSQDNIIKVKCTNDYSLIGKTFVITATTKYGSKSLIVEVASL
jgi:hypothetical protein